MTLAPRRPSSSAISMPIPRPAPVTSATLPAREADARPRGPGTASYLDPLVVVSVVAPGIVTGERRMCLLNYPSARQGLWLSESEGGYLERFTSRWAMSERYLLVPGSVETASRVLLYRDRSTWPAMGR